MCGIIGIFGRADATDSVKKGLGLMENRGRDGYGIAIPGRVQHAKVLSDLDIKDSSALGHCLHAVVSLIPQPIKSKGILVANCEIYNWLELDEKHRLEAKNDAHAMLRMLDRNLDIDSFDGDYACAYWRGDSLTLARDIFGVKPLFYSHQEGFAFASEKKVLEALGYVDVVELNPRQIVHYDCATDMLTIANRQFLSIRDSTLTKTAIKKQLTALLTNAVEKRIPDKKLGILFSGGIDSTLLAFLCKELGKEVTLYTTVLDEPSMAPPADLAAATSAAAWLGLPLRIRHIKLDEIDGYLKKIVPLIEDSNVTKVGVALTMYPACELATEDSCKVIFSGLGSEELFGGYERHREAQDINQECLSGLQRIYERDTYRDDCLTMANGLELRVPFLDLELARFALKIPGKFKVHKGQEKVILHEVAEELGLPEEIAWRRKKAAQYGSRLHQGIDKRSRMLGHKLKSEYLRTFYPSHNLRLGALISGGKDGLYAMHIMQKQNYLVPCIISMKSRNPASYMFHTPAIDMVRLQAEALALPLIEEATDGDKEKELSDLHHALARAQRDYHIDGVITGALYSTYQRDRIERVCDSLGLKVFSPLWHLNQETEMHELLDNGFSFIMTAVAAEGLDRSWLGRAITRNDIDRLSRLREQFGINVAGEGGEFETLVLAMPLFTKQLNITESTISMENACTGVLFIARAELR
jgi:diphthine-ammonia ligase